MRRADLGWWGRHPRFYVTTMTAAAVISTAALVAGVAVGSVGLILTAALLSVLMGSGAIFSWHWWLVGRHRDRATNERQRWKLDQRTIRVSFVLLGVLSVALLLCTAASFYTAWRLDRYGITTTATVERVEPSSTDDHLTVSFRSDGGVRQIEVNGDRGTFAVGDPVAVVYDPDPTFEFGVLAGRSPYLEEPIALLGGAVVLGLIILMPAGRRYLRWRSLRHWTDRHGVVRPPRGLDSPEDDR